MKLGFICIKAQGHLNQKLQRQIVKASGLSVAADVVEKALGVREAAELTK
jgi:hypothetical protein